MDLAEKDMTKRAKTTFGVFTESIGLYISAFDKFMKYMTFPVLGQIFGLGLTFFITYFYALNMPKLIEKYPNLNSMGTLVLISVLIALPGIAIFCKAFWEYLVAYGSINSMFVNLVKSGKLYDFDAHNELIKRRTVPFIGLWMLFGIFSIIAVCPLFLVICGIFAVYFVLIFQVFTFEMELSPVGCLKKSLMLVKGNFIQTFLLIVLAGMLTYLVIPQIIVKGLGAIGIITALSDFIAPFVNIFPEINLEQYGLGIISHKDIALFTVEVIFAQIIIQYTLPFRSILWSNWYKELNDGIALSGVRQAAKNIKTSKTKSSSKKRPSERLIEETRKKYSSKKLDDNILRRAMEKEEEEE